MYFLEALVSFRQAAAACSLSLGSAFTFDHGSGHLRQRTAPFLFLPFFLYPFVFCRFCLVFPSFSFRCHWEQCAHGRYYPTAARLWHVAFVMVEAISAPPASSPRVSSAWVVGGFIAPLPFAGTLARTMVVVGRFRQELYSLSVVGGRFYFDAAGVVSGVRCRYFFFDVAGVVSGVRSRLLFLRLSWMGDITTPPAAGLALVWLRCVQTRLLLRGTCARRAALLFSSTQFDGGFYAPPPPGWIIFVSLLRGAALDMLP